MKTNFIKRYLFMYSCNFSPREKPSLTWRSMEISRKYRKSCLYVKSVRGCSKYAFVFFDYHSGTQFEIL